MAYTYVYPNPSAKGADPYPPYITLRCETGVEIYLDKREAIELVAQLLEAVTVTWPKVRYD